MTKIRSIVILLCVFFASGVVFAHDDALHVAEMAIGGEVEDKQKQITELESKIKSLQSKSKTLSDQIVSFDSQAKLATLKIEQTEELVATLSSKILSLEDNLKDRSSRLERQIVQTYKEGEPKAPSLLLSDYSYASLISISKYYEIIQKHNSKFLHDTQIVQSTYSRQRNLVEESKKKLELQKKSLLSIKQDRENLLKQTKNDESVYQQQLEQARREFEQLQKALAAGIKEGPVKSGQVIALMGNSGFPDCSTGPHLHFEVRKDDKWVNAEDYLKSTSDRFGLKIGNGSWDWPMRGDLQITQRYGKTPYSYRYLYSGGIHTGIDMVSSDKAIYAPQDGTLYSYTGKCGSSDLKIKYIDHGSNLKTFYLHVQ